MSNEKMCNITNRSSGVVGYFIPEMNNRLREFYPRETKRVPYAEIEAVSAQPGGRKLLYNYFYIDEPSIIEGTLNITPEPEYYLTEDKIDEWMNTCSLDQFKDALDFAPGGVKDLIKSHAVKLPLNDLQKCNAIKEQTGFDVLQAIKNEQETQADTEGTEPIRQSKRRAEPAVSAPERRITPKYNVVKREGE